MEHIPQGHKVALLDIDG
ncbi:hypothetical protein MJ391_24980 [Escherichia coli]|nr:hypothetical protein MJ391_24980 [Escherichia coli]